MWPGMEVARLREPVGGEAWHPFPRETVFLATTPKRAMPEPDHVAVERAGTRAVRRNRVIGKVAPDDLRQPTSLLGYRLMHALDHRYPILIAPTDSCAKARSSVSLCHKL